ncbi:MAG TPA: heparan-alpha-glucosaminide N-acetyltransferase domain-containing protein [Ignavibacteriales bacterium]|nr:heparan-alpha-glucosaminide N-acetyltransferase domain-containing protein [Ignavibacteriales bacterium]
MDKTKKRFAFIDLYRGWALLFMFETHIFNAMLMPELRMTGWFKHLTFINGLVAPSFLFISGFAFTIASQRKLEAFRQYKFDFWRQMGRIVLIWLVGYSLRLPYLSLQKMLHKATPQELAPFLSVDVLQCIAFGLLLMFVLRLFIKSDTVFNVVLIVITLVSFIFAPLVYKIDFTQYMPVALANYFNEQHGSLFPLFPWLGFMLSGSVIGYYYMLFKNRNDEARFLKLSLRWSIAAILVGAFVLWFPLDALDYISKVTPNQFFFILRLGLVMLLLVSLRYYELWRGTEKSFVMDVGRESLLVYWLHLQVIYRKLWQDTTLYSIVGERFNFLECILASIALAAVMVLAAIVWGRIKKRYKLFSQIAAAGTVTVVVIVFLLK